MSVCPPLAVCSTANSLKFNFCEVSNRVYVIKPYIVFHVTCSNCDQVVGLIHIKQFAFLVLFALREQDVVNVLPYKLTTDA